MIPFLLGMPNNIISVLFDRRQRNEITLMHVDGWLHVLK
jgi:hypothetical protein